MTEEQPEFLTDEELDALDAEIARDMALVRAMNDEVMAKVRRFRAGLAQRGQSATVHEFRTRPSGEDHPQHVREEFRPRPSGERAPFSFPPLPPGDEGTEDSSSL